MNKPIFKKLELVDIEIIKPYLLNNCCRITDWSVGGILLWRDLYNIEYVIYQKTLVLKIKYYCKCTAFSIMCDEYNHDVMEFIKEHCADNHLPLIICLIDRCLLGKLESLEQLLYIKEERAFFDYLYLTEDLQNYRGKKYQTQRNHVNSFKKLNYRVEKWHQDKYLEVIAFLDRYYKDKELNTAYLLEEKHKTYEAFIQDDYYHFEGVLVYVDEQLCGVALGESINDTSYQHIEKALDGYPGIYPFIAQQYALQYEVDKVKYINREDDNGDLGLRYSKNKYRPISLLNKYTVEVSNDKTSG